MNKPAIDRMWDQIRQKYGVYLRLLEELPEDRLQARLIPDARTPAELVAHVSGTIVRDIAEGVAKGEITAGEVPETEVARTLTTPSAAVAFARECWARADEAVSRIGEEELQAIVPTPWNMSFPGWVGFQILGDEFVHHRGQLFTYARACGVAPPFLWSFGENAPEFQPASTGS